MNTVVEKLAAIEKEVAAIQPKMIPLTERIADLHQKVTGFTQQLADLAAESDAVKQDVELTRQSLSKIQTLIGESKVESEQLAAGQEENLQRCETMTAVFGAAFQAVSQFFETAQRMGLADQAKAVFLPPATPPVALPQPEFPQQLESAHETVLPDAIPPEVVAETEPPAPEVSMPECSVAEPVLSESDFDSVTSQPDASELDPLSMPSLPDVAAPPEMVNADLATDLEPDTEPTDEIASQLDVPPLNLAVPDLPAQSEPATDNAEEQDIEAMLATMMTPVTAAAGN